MFGMVLLRGEKIQIKKISRGSTMRCLVYREAYLVEIEEQ